MRAAAEHAEGIAEVPPYLIQQGAVPIRSNMFLRLFNATQFQHRETASLCGGTPSRIFAEADNSMKRSQLVVQFMFSLFSMEHPVHNRREPAQQSHAPSNTLVIAKAILSHAFPVAARVAFYPPQ